MSGPLVLKKSEEFNWEITFDWVDSEGSVNEQTIEFRFKRLNTEQYSAVLDKTLKEMQDLSDEETVKFNFNKRLLLNVIVSVNEDHVDVEGATTQKEILDSLLSWNVIASAVRDGYQDATLRGGQSVDAVKK